MVPKYDFHTQSSWAQRYKIFIEGLMKKEPECITLAGRGHAVVLTHHRGHKAGTSFKSVTANVLFIYFSFHLKVKHWIYGVCRTCPANITNVSLSVWLFSILKKWRKWQEKKNQWFFPPILIYSSLNSGWRARPPSMRFYDTRPMALVAQDVSWGMKWRHASEKQVWASSMCGQNKLVRGSQVGFITGEWRQWAESTNKETQLKYSGKSSLRKYLNLEWEMAS